MIARFLQERMTFLPTPKTTKDFINVIGEEYSLASVRSLFQYFSVMSIQGTFRFMGGHGWYFFFAVTHGKIGYIKYEITAGRVIDGKWKFSAIGSEMLDRTEENFKILKKKLMAVEKFLISCNCVDDLFDKFERLRDDIYRLPPK